MPVEVLAGAVVAHGGSGVCVSGGDLHVTQVDSSVEHRGDESVPQHVRMLPRQVDSRGLVEVLQPAGGRVSVHPRVATVEQKHPAHIQLDLRPTTLQRLQARSQHHTR